MDLGCVDMYCTDMVICKLDIERMRKVIRNV